MTARETYIKAKSEGVVESFHRPDWVPDSQAFTDWAEALVREGMRVVLHDMEAEIGRMETEAQYGLEATR